MRNLITILFIIILFIIIFVCPIPAQELPTKEYTTNYQQVMKRTQWWRDARFGMFIHFGAYSVPARGEWVKTNERLTTETYQKYIDEFNPTNFDAKAWAKAAKAAGMKYAVLTAKHHDGYCLFDSKLTDYKLSKNFGGRDLVREFMDAFRAEGLKVGLYYSFIDWHHPDYPNIGNHPQREDSEFGKRTCNWDNYLKYMHGQIEELVKNYGKLDILWFDYSWDDYSGEKWKANELVSMIRNYQPEIIIDNRLSTNQGTSSNARVLKPTGDFETPEQGIPDVPLVDNYNNPIPWETSLTINDSWGYIEQDNNWKSPELIVQTLVNCVSKNGNFLLNVGPNARGVIPQESLDILAEVGKWMTVNGESVYGCGAASLAKPDWGRYTQKGSTIYANWMNLNIGQLNAKGIDGDKVKNIYLLKSGGELPYGKTMWGNNDPGNFFINVGSLHQKPEKYDTVVKIEMK